MWRNQREEKIVRRPGGAKKDRLDEVGEGAASGFQIDVRMRVDVAQTLRKLTEIQQRVLRILFNKMPWLCHLIFSSAERSR